MDMKKFEYTIHNIIAHPLMEVLHLLGFNELGNKIHDITLPKKDKKKNASELE
jgi:hypothetical protein